MLTFVEVETILVSMEGSVPQVMGALRKAMVPIPC